MANTFVFSKNFLEDNLDLKNCIIHTLSKETDHDKDLICLLNRTQVWRITATQDEEGNPLVTKEMIFKLRIL